MAKKASKRTAAEAKEVAQEPRSITVTYDLFDLPTAQHKAGLAGLLLQIDSMKNRKLLAPSYELLGNSQVSLGFTQDTIQSLFDDLYSAEIAEVRVKSKWQGAAPLREEEKEEEIDGKKKKTRYFFYEVVQPSGNFLKQYITQSPDIWLKLWRDMLWTIPRGNPQSRQPFEQRALGKSCKEGADAWEDLLKTEKSQKNGAFYTVPVASSLWLGAQATNAEGVSFEGRVDQSLLLHFWQLTVLVFVPQVVSPDGTAEFAGYSLAIPDIVDLTDFCFEFPRLLSELAGEARGFRPAEAVVDLPAEGALLFLEHLSQLAKNKAQGVSTRGPLGAIEFFHLVKVGNNIKTLASGRVVPRATLLEDYELIAGKPGQKPPFSNPLFRRGLMLALLNEVPWFQPFGKMFAEWPHHFFVHSDKSPQKLAWFWVDARKKLNQEIDNMPKDSDESPADEDAVLMAVVHRLVRGYVNDRTQRKSGIDVEKFRVDGKINWEKLPKEFHDARRSVGESLFLEFRSRREQAFVDHFAQTLFAAKQYLSDDQFTVIGHALLHRTEDVKTITLMSLSANS